MKYRFMREWGFVQHWETVVEADTVEEAGELFDLYCEENDPVIEAEPSLDLESYEEVTDADIPAVR